MPSPEVIGPHEARESQRAGDAILVDVREAYEREDPAVAEAVWVPLFDIITGDSVLPEGRTLIVMDHDGSRAAFGARWLKEKGYVAVALEGGAVGYVHGTE